MRALWVIVLGLTASLATQGCKHSKPEPIPGPKVGTTIGHVRAAGISWFQGSVEEAFARVNPRRPTGQIHAPCVNRNPNGNPRRRSA
jgi:hypothetical protein